VTLEELIASVNWVPLRRYCQVTGESPKKLQMRVRRGVWIEGVHMSTPPGSRSTFVNIQAVAEWLGEPVEAIAERLAETIRRET